jgi:hypothetical protein
MNTVEMPDWVAENLLMFHTSGRQRKLPKKAADGPSRETADAESLS